MDFSTPSVKQISDFFMYLYQDLNSLFLGPVVAAQQVLDPSPQTSCPRKEKRGGGGGGGAHPLQPSLQESVPGSRYSFTFKMLRVRSFYPLIIK